MKTVNGLNSLTIFPKNAPSQMFDWIPDCRCCKCGVKVNWKCMVFETAVWCGGKKL